MRKVYCGKCAFFGAFDYLGVDTIMVCVAGASFVSSPIHDAVDVEGVKNPMVVNQNNDCPKMRRWSSSGARVLSFMEVDSTMARIDVDQLDRKVGMDVRKRRREGADRSEEESEEIEEGTVELKTSSDAEEFGGGGPSSAREGTVPGTDRDKQLSLDLR